ncbi:uracil-DNA glycosylase [Clostridium aceticum]|nr:hypothetical protein [Clostridium aceticum]KJF28737.1 uracil-DNA glycosylase [Clostridium aceticum]
MKEKRIDCYKCIYFHITWDKKFPRGCKFFGFKTHQLPSISVLQSSGKPCYAFKEKPKDFN